MIKFYVHRNQIHNFIDLKEPVQLINVTYDDNYVEFLCSMKKIKIVEYRTYSTIELKTRRKKVRELWQRLKNIRKKH